MDSYEVLNVALDLINSPDGPAAPADDVDIEDIIGKKPYKRALKRLYREIDELYKRVSSETSRAWKSAPDRQNFDRVEDIVSWLGKNNTLSFMDDDDRTIFSSMDSVAEAMETIEILREFLVTLSKV